MKNLWIFLILFSSATLSVSQEVFTDTIAETILLDRKATIAQGNIVKRHDTLVELYADSKVLADSLRHEIDLSKIKSLTIEQEIVKPLKNTVAQNNLKISSLAREFFIKEEGYKAEIKTQKGKKWTWALWGTAVGAALYALATTFFAGM